MSPEQRAELVRVCRLEIKQARRDGPYLENNRLQGATATIERRGRALGRRVRRGIGRRIDRALEAYDAYDAAQIRRATAEAEARFARDPQHGIGAEFRARSAAIGAAASAVHYRASSGAGANRWRGSIRAAGRSTRYILRQKPRLPREPRLTDDWRAAR